MKTYTEPEMNIIEFETEDVITTSGCNLMTTGDAEHNELPISPAN